MAPQKLQLLSWVGVLVSIGIGLLGLSDRYASTSSRIALGSALAGLVAVIIWRSRAKARLQEERDAARLQDLKRHFELVGTPIEIRGSSALAPLLVFGAFALGMLVIAWRDPSVPNIIAAVAMLLCFGFLFPMFLPTIGKPLATIYRDGIEVPACGKLEWSEIEGMGLRTHEAMALEQHFLDLYVPGLADRQDRMHPAYRIFHRLPIPGTRKRSVPVRLVGTEDSPKIIEQVCRHLWTARTGRSAQWNALMRERDFEKLRQRTSS